MRFWLVAVFALLGTISSMGTRAGALAEGVSDRQGRPGQRSSLPHVRSATGDALDRYVGGDYDGAIAQLTYLGGFSTVDGDEWIKNGGLRDGDRRRLIAASLAIEVTAAKEAWPVTLVEWACETLRNAGPPSPNELLWMRTSVALAEGDGMWAILGDSAHLGHALARFPDDPHFKLAQAFVAAAVATQPAVTTGTTVTDQTPVAFDRVAASRLDLASTATASEAAAFERAAAKFEALENDPTVGAEARLRFGDLELRLGHRDMAADAFRQADAFATDPFVQYLARLFLAWTDADSGRTDEAIRGYRAALAVMPHARAASTLLATRLILNNQLDQAETVMSDFIAAGKPGDDPWRMYPKGDFREYLSLIAQLHEAIKR